MIRRFVSLRPPAAMAGSDAIFTKNLLASRFRNIVYSQSDVALLFCRMAFGEPVDRHTRRKSIWVAGVIRLHPEWPADCQPCITRYKSDCSLLHRNRLSN